MMIAVGVLAMLLTQDSTGFDHPRHRRLFPSCATCHAGAAPGSGGASLWPDPRSCAACHDGSIERTVIWRAPAAPRVSNLRFDHQRHPSRPEAAATCGDCHTEAGAARMAVQPAVVARCLQCHGIQTAHLAAPDSSCRTCHVALAAATRLTREQISVFPAPPSHRHPDYGGGGHGAVTRAAVATSCATCHARDFCYQCHAGGRPPSVIAALASDTRSLAIAARAVPASHGAAFADRHGAIAAANAARCASCHVRSDCLDCHRPGAAAASGYHDAGFLTRHPAAAYARESSCNDCHSERAFCSACHEQSGLVAQRGLRTSYHDAKQFFVAGHGQAARQSLESCVSCHTERDCLPCHSAQGGRRLSPHGPGFDPARMRRKNFEVCTVCHGAAVPAR